MQGRMDIKWIRQQIGPLPQTTVYIIFVVKLICVLAFYLFLKKEYLRTCNTRTVNRSGPQGNTPSPFPLLVGLCNVLTKQAMISSREGTKSL